MTVKIAKEHLRLLPANLQYVWIIRVALILKLPVNHGNVDGSRRVLVDGPGAKNSIARALSRRSGVPFGCPHDSLALVACSSVMTVICR